MTFKNLSELSRSKKRALVVALDLVIVLFTVWFAIYLRIDQLDLPRQQQLNAYLIAPLIGLPIFINFGLYRAIFRYTGMAALFTIVKAVAVYAVIYFFILLYAKWEGVPRSVGLIQPLLFLLLVGGSRAFARYWLAGASGKSHKAKDRGRLLIYGAGAAGVETASALAMNRQFHLLGFVDDDTTKVGGSINGVNIISMAAVPDAVERMGVTDILLAIPSLGRTQRNEIIARLRTLPVHVRTLPGLGDLAAGRVTLQDFQELDVEDLLARMPVPPDRTLLANNLTYKTVLVTGAGGSIGSELCRQIITEKPSRLILLDHNEFGLYTIHSELLHLCVEKGVRTEIVPLLASVNNYERLQQICQLYRPATIYHAAAYKHVPLVESNFSAGVLNNIFGTLNMARAAIENKVSHFVLVSTDKAVRPTNVMGATKRMAELVLQALADNKAPQFDQPDGTKTAAIENKTLFAMVRFGNVLGSSGSVVPLFRKQLQNGGPITITHLNVTRFFMTIPEASQLVLQAGAMTQGGDVFVLDMGEPVKILDLAHRMAQLSGLTLRDANNPDGDIEIEVSGLRPGEKLYEELLIGDNPEPTDNARIMKAREEFVVWPELAPLLVALREAAVRNDEHAIKKTLSQLVQGYKPAENELIVQRAVAEEV
jgi:FlaA1/EpsC-like NDP-sugar epimerase